MKDRQFGIAKWLFAVSMLGILTSVIMFQGIGVPTVHLQKYEWARWFLFVSWVLYFLTMIAAGMVALMKSAPEAPATEGEGEALPAPEAIPKKVALTLRMLYGSGLAFLLGTASMLVYFAFVTLPTLPKSVTGF